MCLRTQPQEGHFSAATSLSSTYTFIVTNISIHFHTVSCVLVMFWCISSLSILSYLCFTMFVLLKFHCGCVKHQFEILLNTFLVKVKGSKNGYVKCLDMTFVSLLFGGIQITINLLD